MEATCLLHPRFSLYAKPLSVNHKAASRQLTLMSFYQNGVSLHGKQAERSSSRAFVVGCIPPTPGRKDGDDMATHCPLPALKRSLSLNTLRRGKVALEGFLDPDKVARDSTLLANAEHEFRELLKQEKCDPGRLQEAAWKLEMSGKEDEAVEMLQEKFAIELLKTLIRQEAFELCILHIKMLLIYQAVELIPKKSRIELLKNVGQEAYELGLLLVEMLIYQGEFRAAEALCKSLTQDGITTDARPPLYLAVTYLMMGETEKSKAKWEEFNGPDAVIPILDSEDNEPKDLQHTESTFENFKKDVGYLKEEIRKARNA